MTRQLEFLEYMKDEALKHAASLRFEKSNHQHLYSMALYGSIVELTTACIILIKEDVSIAVPILFRTVLEAHVDLTNVCADASYCRNMEANDLKEWIKILKEAGREENPYLASISRLEDRSSVLANQEADLRILGENGYHPLTAFDRFSKASLKKEYRSIYNLVCFHSHNNITSLIRRHIDIQGDAFTVTYFKETDSSYLIDSLSGTLIDASCKVHRLLGSQLLPTLEKIWDELTKLRQDLGIVSKTEENEPRRT